MRQCLVRCAANMIISEFVDLQEQIQEFQYGGELVRKRHNSKTRSEGTGLLTKTSPIYHDLKKEFNIISFLSDNFPNMT